MTTSIQALADPDFVQPIETLLKKIVEAPWHLNTDWLTSRSWFAIPMESGSYFEEQDAANTAEAIRSLGYMQCVAIATETVGRLPRFYRVSATKAGLLEFSNACAGLNYMLTSEDIAFVVLCTSEDYNIFAGPRSFVERAVGMSIEDARRTFREFGFDEWWEGRLLKVAEKYESVP